MAQKSKPATCIISLSANEQWGTVTSNTTGSGGYYVTEKSFNISYSDTVYAIVGSSLVNTTGSNFNRAVKFHSATKDKFIIASETPTATWVAIGK